MRSWRSATAYKSSSNWRANQGCHDALVLDKGPRRTGKRRGSYESASPATRGPAPAGVGRCSDGDDHRAELFRDLLGEEPTVSRCQVVVVRSTRVPRPRVRRHPIAEQDEDGTRDLEKVSEQE